MCLCLYRLHLLIYPFLQWLSLMYHDRNKYMNYQPCEYCGEPFHLYEKLVFPKNCQNNPKGPTKVHTPHFSENL